MIIIMPPGQTQRVHIFWIHTHRINFRRKCRQILTELFHKQCELFYIFIRI